MRRLLNITFLTVMALCVTVGTHAQVAVKTNLLYDALLNANLGAEFNIVSHWSLDLSGNYNGWKLSGNRQWKHWFIQPEARYWLKDNMKGHFFAANIVGGQFNTTLRQARRQGWFAGIGVGYGYSWRLGRYWGIEAELTAGYARYSYDKFPCARCGRKTGHRDRNYVGPTKAAVNLVYYIGGRKKKEVEMPEIQIEEPVATVIADTVRKFNFTLVDVPHSRILSENIAGVSKVRFGVNKTDIDLNDGNNMAEVSSILSKLDSIRNNLDMQIASVAFVGYASPEGSYDNNDRLAAARTAALREYIGRAGNLPDSVVSQHHVAEDWDGLRVAVDGSVLPDRIDILTIIDSDMTPDSKEAALRRHRQAWTWISSEVLPELRRTEYIIRYEHRYEEKEVLTLEEVNDAVRNGDLDRAAALLVDIPSSPEADYSRGVVAALQQRYEEAQAWFARAASRGVAAASDALDQLKNK